MRNRARFLIPVVVAAMLSASMTFSQSAFAVQQDWFVEVGVSLACDDLGTDADPFQSVQCAIDAATAGDTVRVKAGNHAGFVVNKSLAILGPNDGVTPLPGIARQTEAVIVGAVSIAPGTDGTTISGLSLLSSTSEGVGLSVGSDSRNVSLTYNDISGFDQGIYSGGNAVSFGSDMDVSHNYIHGLTLGETGSYAIHLRNVKNLTVSENIITDNVTDPAVTGDEYRRGILLRGTENAVVNNNMVDFGLEASSRAKWAISVSQKLNDGVNGDDLQVANVEISDNVLSGTDVGINISEVDDQATGVVVTRNTARHVFTGISFKSFGQAVGEPVVPELLVEQNDFSDIEAGAGVLSAGVQVFSLAVSPPVSGVFDGVIVHGNRLPANKINEFSEINGLMMGAINPFAAGFPAVLTFYETDVTDLDARANYWGSNVVPTLNAISQVNFAGSIVSFAPSEDAVGQAGFWPNCATIQIGGTSSLDVQALFACPAGAPGTPTATAGNRTASVAWTAPTFGVVPFTYTVTSSPAGATCLVTGLTAACTGLTNGTSYTLTVTATNAFGSATSGSSGAVRPTAPQIAPVPAPSATPTPVTLTEEVVNGLNDALASAPIPTAAIEVPEGGLGAQVGGVKVEVRIVSVEELLGPSSPLLVNSSQVAVSEDAQSLTIANPGGGAPLVVDVETLVVMEIAGIFLALGNAGGSDAGSGGAASNGLPAQPGDALVTIMSGLPANIALRTFLFSDPFDAGTTFADESGNAVVVADLPSDLAAGQHYLQIDTATAAGDPVSIAMALSIGESQEVAAIPEPTKSTNTIPDWLLIGGALVAVLVGSVVLYRRLRVKKG